MHRHLRPVLRLASIALLLVLGLLTPLTATFALPTLVVAVVLVGTTCAWMWWPRAGLPRWWRRAKPGTLALLMQLSPVLVLTAAFPIATARIGGSAVGEVALTDLLLAASLTVPWLSQAVCLPLYRGIGTHVWQGDMAGARDRFCRMLVPAAVQSLPVVALFAALVEVVMRWSPEVLAAYVVLCLLHVLFVQSLVMTNVGRHRLQWALAWSTYAAALLAVPTWWWLPPLAGALWPLFFFRRHLHQALRPVWLERADVTQDVVRGLLAGSVLWSDKLLLFLRTDGSFPVQTVFIALLPAVIVYNYYFVRLAGPFDRAVGELRQAMERYSSDHLTMVSGQMVHTVSSGLYRAGLLSALLTVLTLTLLSHEGGSVRVAAPVAVTSFMLLMTSITIYKLDYIGRTGTTQALGAAHLVLCLLAFGLTDSIPAAYGVLVVGEALVLAVAVRAALSEWRNAEYSLFWRHATSW